MRVLGIINPSDIVVEMITEANTNLAVLPVPFCPMVARVDETSEAESAVIDWIFARSAPVKVPSTVKKIKAYAPCDGLVIFVVLLGHIRKFPPSPDVAPRLVLYSVNSRTV